MSAFVHKQALLRLVIDFRGMDTLTSEINVKIILPNPWKMICSKSKGFAPSWKQILITKTRLYNFDLLKPHFYIV